MQVDEAPIGRRRSSVLLASCRVIHRSRRHVETYTAVIRGEPQRYARSAGASRLQVAGVRAGRAASRRTRGRGLEVPGSGSSNSIRSPVRGCDERDPPRVQERPREAERLRVVAAARRRPGRPGSGGRSLAGGRGSDACARCGARPPAASRPRGVRAPRSAVSAARPSAWSTTIRRGAAPQRRVHAEVVVLDAPRGPARGSAARPRAALNIAASASWASSVSATTHQAARARRPAGARCPGAGGRPMVDSGTSMPSSRFTRVPLRRPPWGG